MCEGKLASLRVFFAVLLVFLLDFAANSFVLIFVLRCGIGFALLFEAEQRLFHLGLKAIL